VRDPEDEGKEAILHPDLDAGDTVTCYVYGSLSPDPALTPPRLIDREYTAHPLLGKRRLTPWLIEHEEVVNCERVRRLTRVEGLDVLVPRFEPGDGVSMQGWRATIRRSTDGEASCGMARPVPGRRRVPVRQRRSGRRKPGGRSQLRLLCFRFLHALYRPLLRLDP
jgi:hypothetical protein